jgi:tRNA-splicing ligase RtcB
MNKKYKEWGYELPDRELIYAPFNSTEGQDYFRAMSASANFAWANRHVIGHQIKRVWNEIFGTAVPLRTMYDISHNIGKIETHSVNGTQKKLLLHRKGATRAFYAGHKDVPQEYRSVGHPVLIPGTMGTASYVLVGTENNPAFFSSCHGAGRHLSRTAAKHKFYGETVRAELEKRGIAIRSESDPGLAEEAPEAYKDIDLIIKSVSQANLAKPVARLRPLAVIKG